MNRFGTKRPLVVCVVSFISVSILLMFYGWIVRRANCAPYCSPVISVTNYSQFSDLLQNLAKNLMIGQLKANLSQKTSISFKPGNFMGFGDLAGINDFSSMISDVVGEGLRLQVGFVNADMSLANFTGSLNNAAMAALQKELRQKRFDGNDITAVLKSYRRVLASAGLVGTYSGQVNEYRSMVSGFLPVASNLITQTAGLSGKIDVASSLPAQQKDVTGHTREALRECAAHARDGLYVLGNIGNTSIGDTVGTQFTAANSKCLKTMLGKMTTTARVGLTGEEIERIIVKVNNAAAQTVPQYIARSTNSLENISLSTMASVGTIMRAKVQSALEAINRSAAAEKAKEAAITSIYSSIESEVQGLLGNQRSYGKCAREKGPGPLFDNGNTKTIMVLLASRGSSATRKKLAVKHYILARTSLEIASSIKTRLNSFDPATVDSGYEDQAWKDVSRLQYYLLYLDNQRLKLMAIRAMAQAADTDDPDILKYVDNSGLPAD